MAQNCSDSKMTTDSKKGVQVKPEVKNAINKVVTTLTKNTAATQLIVGSLSGWTTGYMAMKVGRPAAIAAGGGIILFQIAQHTGYVNMDWEKVRQKAESTTKKFDATYKERAPHWISKAKKFARTNTYFTAGFVGGFLIGLAS